MAERWAVPAYSALSPHRSLLSFPALHQFRLGENLLRQADAEGELLSLFERQLDGRVVAFFIHREREIGLGYGEVALFGAADRDGIENNPPELAFFVVGFLIVPGVQLTIDPH